MTEADFEAVASLLSSGRRFLLTGHRNPDGDSLGSALALAQALQDRGKEALVVMRDRWSSSYEGMPGVEDVEVSETLPPDWPAAWDAAIVMECPEAERPGFPALLSGTTVNVDHHPGNTRWATHNLVVLPAAAVGEIVADLLDRLEWPMTPRIATNLWVSLVSDTGLVPLREHDRPCPRARRPARDGRRAARRRERVPLRGPAPLDGEAREPRPRDARAARRGTRRPRLPSEAIPRRVGRRRGRRRGAREPGPGHRGGEGRRPRPRERRAGGLPLLPPLEGVRRRPLRRVGAAAAAVTATPPAAASRAPGSPRRPTSPARSPPR